jgi:hypothetical protein
MRNGVRTAPAMRVPQGSTGHKAARRYLLQAIGRERNTSSDR